MHIHTYHWGKFLLKGISITLLVCYFLSPRLGLLICSLITKKHIKVIFLESVKALSHAKSEINKPQAKASASAPHCITLLVT